VELIRLPDHVLPAPRARDLPAPLPLRAMLGPSLILTGLSIGSGELVLWPRLTATYGFAVFWAACLGVTLQLFLNLEIERYTLATGESAVTGFVRLWRGFGPVFLACTTLPWIWPGWATGAATLLVWETGGSAPLIAVGGLVACGLLLSLGPVVYRTLELTQLLLVGAIFAFLVWIALQTVSASDLAALGSGLLRVGHVPSDLSLPFFLGALAFAGAGGTVNLAQSNYIRDKGYGMGRFLGRLTSPFTGREEASEPLGFGFAGTPENLARWRTWWRRANVEHTLSFWLLCLVSLCLTCLITFSLLSPGAAVGEDFAFLADQAARLAQRFGEPARHAFLAAGVAVLLSTELALLDAVSRVAADVIHVSASHASAGWLRRVGALGLSRTYFGIVWALVGFGCAVIAWGLHQPLALIVLSASLNAVVMFLYSGLLLWLNLRSFRGPLRPGPLRIAALLGALAFFGWFSALTVVAELARAFG
jgi:hypothetical protein